MRSNQNRKVCTDLVHIELVEAGVWVRVGHADDLRRNYFAGTAPCCHAIKDHDGRVGDGFVKVCLAVKGEMCQYNWARDATGRKMVRRGPCRMEDD